MKPVDIATFYYCFTKIGFKGEGLFYKYLQKSLTKTIRAFEGPEIAMMFFKFDDVDQMRLNRGVRGRLIDHCEYLIRENKLSGYDANQIFEHTQRLEYEPPRVNSSTIDMSDDAASKNDIRLKTKKKFVHHDLHVHLRSYLEKLKYFN